MTDAAFAACLAAALLPAAITARSHHDTSQR
jgi:hypothetical protein